MWSPSRITSRPASCATPNSTPSSSARQVRTSCPKRTAPDPEQHEHGREAGHEGEAGEHHAAAQDGVARAIVHLLHGDSRDQRQVGRHQGQHAGREHGQETRGEREIRVGAQLGHGLPASIAARPPALPEAGGSSRTAPSARLDAEAEVFRGSRTGAVSGPSVDLLHVLGSHSRSRGGGPVLRILAEELDRPIAAQQRGRDHVVAANRRRDHRVQHVAVAAGEAPGQAAEEQAAGGVEHLDRSVEERAQRRGGAQAGLGLDRVVAGAGYPRSQRQQDDAREHALRVCGFESFMEFLLSARRRATWLAARSAAAPDAPRRSPPARMMPLARGTSRTRIRSAVRCRAEA